MTLNPRHLMLPDFFPVSTHTDVGRRLEEIVGVAPFGRSAWPATVFTAPVDEIIHIDTDKDDIVAAQPEGFVVLDSLPEPVAVGGGEFVRVVYELEQFPVTGWDKPGHTDSWDRHGRFPFLLEGGSFLGAVLNESASVAKSSGGGCAMADTIRMRYNQLGVCWHE